MLQDFVDMRTLVLDKERQGNVVFKNDSGVFFKPIEELVDLPIEIALESLKMTPKDILCNVTVNDNWINEYALVQMVRFLSNKLKTIEEYGATKESEE